MSLTWSVLHGDALAYLSGLPEKSYQACVTSPPYWGLRDYGIGLEQTPAAYVGALVEVFHEVRRVLRDDGVLWLNVGDSYQNAKGQARGVDPKQPARRHGLRPMDVSIDGLKPKDLVGIPWRLAFALQDDGWYLRSDTIWAKPNPMPESVQDRPTRSHEYVFLLAKSKRYYYDAEAIREKYAESTVKQFDSAYTGEARKDYESAGVQNPSDVKRRIVDKQAGHGRRHKGFNERWYGGKHMDNADEQAAGRRICENVKKARDAGAPHDNPFGFGANSRSVWTIATEASDVDHFAVMPKALARKCVLSACGPEGIVLDPFAGAGTTGVVALEEGRSFVGIELNPTYAAIARERLAGAMPLFAREA